MMYRFSSGWSLGGSGRTFDFVGVRRVLGLSFRLHFLCWRGWVFYTAAWTWIGNVQAFALGGFGGICGKMDEWMGSGRWREGSSQVREPWADKTRN